MAGARETLSQALKTFLFSLSEGAAGQAQFPGARGTRAGMAAAFGAPFKLEEIQRQRGIQDEERAQRAQQLQRAAMTGDFNAMMDIIKETQGQTMAPEIKVPMAPMMPSQLSTSPMLPGSALPNPAPNIQPEGQRAIPMPLQPFNVTMPNGQQRQIPQMSRQQAQQSALDMIREKAQIESDFAPDRFTQGPMGVLDTRRGTLSARPQQPNMAALAASVLRLPSTFQQLPAETRETLLPILAQAGFKPPDDKSEREMDVADYEKHPELTSKYGMGRTGYTKWQDSMRSNELLDAIRATQYANLKEAAPGQLIFKTSGNPVPPQAVPSGDARRLADISTALQQADTVAELLVKVGDTGAIKGYVFEHGVYWPVVQDVMTPEQAELVSESQRMLANYARAISGLAVSDQEIQRLAKSSVSFRLTPEVNKRILGHFKRNAINEQNNYLNLRGWKYKEDGGGDSGGGSYTDNGRTFNIPADKVDAFLKDHPNAKKVGP